MGWFIEGLKKVNDKDVQELVAAAEKKVAKQVRKQIPATKVSKGYLFQNKVVGAIATIRSILGRYTNVRDAEVKALAEKSVSQAWNYLRLKDEVNKIRRVADKRAISNDRIARDNAIKEIDSKRAKVVTAAITRIVSETGIDRVGWTTDDIISMLSTPSCRKVADRLGYMKDRDGSVTGYLTWRLGIKYEYGKEARSVDDIKTLRLAANEVLKLKK